MDAGGLILRHSSALNAVRDVYALMNGRSLAREDRLGKSDRNSRGDTGQKTETHTMERQNVLLLLALSETTPLTDDVMALTDDPHFWQSLMETEEADLTADQRKVLMALGVNSGFFR